MAGAGMPKTGGRKKGTVNKSKQALIERINAEYPDYHPVMAMADVANDDDAPPDMRFQANREVAQYIEPKRKAIEMSGSTGIHLRLTDLTGNK